MTESVACCHDDNLETAAMMAAAHARRLPVLWHSGQSNLTGMVSFHDIADKVDGDRIHELPETQHLPGSRIMARFGKPLREQ